jgi:hypothetical protein
VASPDAIQTLASPGFTPVAIRVSLGPLDASDQGHHIQEIRFDFGLMPV